MKEIMETKSIESKIYNIRGVEVMLDSDLAKIYECANGTKTINLAVKRNIERFPDDFYFQLNEEEYNTICGFNLKLQNNKIRSLPHVFTEQGVAMLAAVIRTDITAKVSINIMIAFVHMRHYIKYNEQLLPRKYLLLEEKVDKNTKRIEELFNKFDHRVITKNSIFFKADIYDAYSVLLEIFNIAKEEIIIIDRKRIFHCGASFKDLGKKCFGIHEIENKIEIEKLVNEVINNCSIDN